MSKPKNGEVWYVSVSGSIALSKMKVIKITPLVVEIMPVTTGLFASSTTYKKSIVDFVEKANE